MYTLYIANKNYSSWSLRPWVLLSELGIPFTEELRPFSAEAPGGNWKEFRKFSPTGRVPCLIDGETTVWDSLGIAEYLAERHEGAWPADAKARAWARCAAAEMHSGFSTLRKLCPLNIGIRVRLNEQPPELKEDLRRLGELWSEGLVRFGGPFLGGSRFSAVDAFFAPVAFRAQTHGLSFGPAGDAYLQRLLALPSLQRWQTAALAETWREAHHEEEALRTGTLLEDLRARP